MDEKVVSKRVPRNLLPCVGDTADGDAWARTADWRGLYLRRARDGDDRMQDDLTLMGEVLRMSLRLGYMRDTRVPLVEAHCGSCGCRRGERHAIETEPALLYTHHASAPAVNVSYLCPFDHYVSLSVRWFIFVLCRVACVIVVCSVVPD